MERHFALILVLLMSGACFVLADDDKPVVSQNHDDLFTIPHIMSVIAKLSKFQQLVVEHNDTLNLQELRDSVHEAFEKAVQCFQEELKDSNSALVKLMDEFRKSATGDTETQPPADSLNPYQKIQKLIELFLKFRESLKNPEIQEEIAGMKDKVKIAIEKAALCFQTFAKELVPADKLKILTDLWTEAMNSK